MAAVAAECGAATGRRRTRWRAAAATLLLALLLTGVGGATGANATKQDQADIARIEAYLQNLRTLKARFVQIAPDGSLAQGTLYVQRPDKMRVEYDGPVPNLMVATGVWLIVYDGELQETSYLPLDSSPAAVLIQDEIAFGRDVSVTEVERQPGTLRVRLERPETTGTKQSLYLTFTDPPLRLREWTVVDARGQATQVTLINPEYDVALDPVLFKYAAPGPDQYSQ